MRILCIDPGEKRIGVALSDPSGSFAAPMTVLEHRSRAEDAQAVARLAHENDAGRIVVGHALDADNRATPQSRRAYRLAAAIRLHTDLTVTLWDESGSTQAAQQAQIEMNTSRKARRGHLDAAAAAVILQSYLDAHRR